MESDKALNDKQENLGLRIWKTYAVFNFQILS